MRRVSRDLWFNWFNPDWDATSDFEKAYVVAFRPRNSQVFMLMFKCFAGQIHIARTGLHLVESQGLVDELIAFPLVIPVDVFC